MNKELNNMRKLRIEREKFKALLKMHTKKSIRCREHITNLWEDKSKDLDVSIHSSYLLQERAAINDCQSKLRDIKKGIRESNRAYDLTHKCKTSKQKKTACMSQGNSLLERVNKGMEDFHKK